MLRLTTLSILLLLPVSFLSSCSSANSSETAKAEEKKEEASEDSSKDDATETAKAEDASAKDSADQDKEDKKEEEDEGPVVRVRVSPLVRDRITSVIETTSTVEAENIVDVFPKYTGIVAKIFVEEGDQVRPGKILAQLDDREARLRASQAEVAHKEGKQRVEEATLGLSEAEQREKVTRNTADQAKKDYERNQNLWDEGNQGKRRLISEKELEGSKLAWKESEGAYQQARFATMKTKASLESLKIAAERLKITWDLAKVELEEMALRSRIDGVVSLRGIKVGQTVNPTTQAFTIVDLRQLVTYVYRPQRELRFLKKDLPVDATAEAVPNAFFQGRVLRVNPIVDANSGTFKITAMLENPDFKLRPGMLIRSKITTEVHDNAVLVPKKAIFYKKEQPTVFAVREGKAVRVALEAGFTNRDHIEVLNISPDGLREDDRIIVVGNAELRDGTKVEVVDS